MRNRISQKRFSCMTITSALKPKRQHMSLIFGTHFVLDRDQIMEQGKSDPDVDSISRHPKLEELSMSAEFSDWFKSY
ncbi:hypothetical protein PHJA_001667700 [Phtheirospermum japonicum]|uniref:Uncharacterized protein n=1 Tax=Phtheirospermum japonicum TaxID=374723 RepID=A0A830CH46_9LAMI|nr:hypothetical protein PHJA_001667700 [Phtheirospermum japonicum]